VSGGWLGKNGPVRQRVPLAEPDDLRILDDLVAVGHCGVTEASVTEPGVLRVFLVARLSCDVGVTLEEAQCVRSASRCSCALTMVRCGR
jgi:hypothetical protein